MNTDTGSLQHVSRRKWSSRVFFTIAKSSTTFAYDCTTFAYVCTTFAYDCTAWFTHPVVHCSFQLATDEVSSLRSTAVAQHYLPAAVTKKQQTWLGSEHLIITTVATLYSSSSRETDQRHSQPAKTQPRSNVTVFNCSRIRDKEKNNSIQIQSKDAT